MAELFNGVYTGGFEQFGKLPRNTFDAEQVGMVSPTENLFGWNAGFIGEFFTTLWGGGCSQKVFGGFNAGGFEFLCVAIANTFDFNDFLRHSFFVDVC